MHRQKKSMSYNLASITTLILRRYIKHKKSSIMIDKGNKKWKIDIVTEERIYNTQTKIKVYVK